MPRITFIQPDGTSRTIDAQVGLSLMQVEIANAIQGIDALCGGACMCATCQVHIDPAQGIALPPRGQMEQDLLDVAQGDVDHQSRLSCQIPVTEALEGLVVRIARRQG